MGQQPARHAASRGPASPRHSAYIASRIADSPAIRLVHSDPYMDVSVHDTDLESLMYVRSSMPTYTESISGLYDREATREWVKQLLAHGFVRTMTGDK